MFAFFQANLKLVISLVGSQDLVLKQITEMKSNLFLKTQALANKQCVNADVKLQCTEFRCKIFCKD